MAKEVWVPRSPQAAPLLPQSWLLCFLGKGLQPLPTPTGLQLPQSGQWFSPEALPLRQWLLSTLALGPCPDLAPLLLRAFLGRSVPESADGKPCVLAS